ncbi:hypothetical protein L596_029709 [Steinernema carpocapsae]|uniref:Uncharacterized protein n=1 Tax=Steinernema carpocapsae TaxID=34508 RepID=A0A4V5ZXB1_STECR|nr:hypothetical protein L596_029709 [Steinernema carpocapsae]
MDRQALCKKTKIHGNIESKQDAERNDDGTPKKLPNSNFADDSYSRNEKMLRFFAASDPDPDRIGSKFRIPDPDPDRIGSNLDPIRHLWSWVRTPPEPIFLFLPFIAFNRFRKRLRDAFDGRRHGKGTESRRRRRS